MHAYITSIWAKYHRIHYLLMLRTAPQLSSPMPKYFTIVKFLYLYYEFVFFTPYVVLGNSNYRIINL
jgi:hypothetical protein